MKHPFLTMALTLTLLSVFSVGFAEEKRENNPAGEEEGFAKRKAMMIQNMEKKLACLRSANNRQQVRECEEQMKKERLKHSMEKLDQQQQELEERKQRLQEKMGEDRSPPRPR